MKKIILKESQLVNITEKVIKEQYSDDPNAFETGVKKYTTRITPK